MWAILTATLRLIFLMSLIIKLAVGIIACIFILKISLPLIFIVVFIEQFTHSSVTQYIAQLGMTLGTWILSHIPMENKHRNKKTNKQHYCKRFISKQFKLCEQLVCFKRARKKAYLFPASQLSVAYPIISTESKSYNEFITNTN